MQCFSCGSCRSIICTLIIMMSFFDQVRTVIHMRTTYRPGMTNGANHNEPMSAQLTGSPHGTTPGQAAAFVGLYRTGYRDDNRQRTMTLDGGEFIRRFLIH